MNLNKARRYERINWIRQVLEKIKEKDKEIDKEKVIAEIMIRHGVSRRIAVEDLNAVMLYIKF